MASCAPVPAAATTPTGPGVTTLAKPRPTPPSIAVPAPGPISSRPRDERVVLERHLLVDRHVVAEQQDVQVRRQRLVGGQRGVVPGHRDHRDVGRRLARARRRAASAAARAGRLPPSGRVGGRDGGLAGGQRLRGGRVVGRPDDQEEVVGADAADLSAASTPSARRVSTFAGVAMAALAHSTPSTSRIARIATQLHHGVDVGVGEELDGHASCETLPARLVASGTIRVPTRRRSPGRCCASVSTTSAGRRDHRRPVRRRADEPDGGAHLRPHAARRELPVAEVPLGLRRRRSTSAGAGSACRSRAAPRPRR